MIELRQSRRMRVGFAASARLACSLKARNVGFCCRVKACICVRPGVREVMAHHQPSCPTLFTLSATERKSRQNHILSFTQEGGSLSVLDQSYLCLCYYFLMHVWVSRQGGCCRIVQADRWLYTSRGGLLLAAEPLVERHTDCRFSVSRCHPRRDFDCTAGQSVLRCLKPSLSVCVGSWVGCKSELRREWGKYPNLLPQGTM